MCLMHSRYSEIENDLVLLFSFFKIQREVKAAGGNPAGLPQSRSAGPAVGPCPPGVLLLHTGVYLFAQRFLLGPSWLLGSRGSSWCGE